MALHTTYLRRCYWTMIMQNNEVQFTALEHRTTKIQILAQKGNTQLGIRFQKCSSNLKCVSF